MNVCDSHLLPLVRITRRSLHYHYASTHTDLETLLEKSVLSPQVFRMCSRGRDLLARMPLFTSTPCLFLLDSAILMLRLRQTGLGRCEVLAK